MTTQILRGDCRLVLADLPAESVHCCVTSPPYFGLRDYGHAGQIGLEQTPAEYVEQLVQVFREVRRVLRGDGTLWLNLGDSYSSNGTTRWPCTTSGYGKHGTWHGGEKVRPGGGGLAPKQLLGIPWRVAFALQDDGWYLRQDIIWHKPNPMPESVTDRCTKAHEYVFLLSKSPRYFYDVDAVAEPAIGQNEHDLTGRSKQRTADGERSKRDSFKRDDSKRAEVIPGQTVGTHRPDREESAYPLDTRNRRSVWTIATKPFKEAHFATMAPELAETCIKAGCPIGGTVLDPFGGAGTTGLVADRLQRDAVLVELNPDYIKIARERITGDAPLFAEVAA